MPFSLLCGDLLSMCSPQTIEWIYRRPRWLTPTPTTTPKPAACWSSGRSSTTSYCFSVLASAMNRSIWVYLAKDQMIVRCKLLQLCWLKCHNMWQYLQKGGKSRLWVLHTAWKYFDELPIALYCASLAGSVSEICSLKVQNYEHLVFKKLAFKHLLQVNPTFCHVTNDAIAK